MHLFYDPLLTVTATEHLLSEEESKHACKVLRLAQGNQVILLNGRGLEAIATIKEAHPKRCKVEIQSRKIEATHKKQIHIAIAPTKIIDRLEWFLEKATEIGVTEISLVICSNSERKLVKEERLEKILIAAMKQSKRLFLPHLNELCSFSSFLKNNPKGLIAHCYEAPKETISALLSDNNCPILIGPEGDFSEQEVLAALQSGYKTITLGENRLRTETAGLYAVMQAKMKL